MARRRTARRSDWSTKQWFTVIAPEAFGEKEVGETVADVPEKLEGRTIETTYGDLSGDMSKQNTKLKFKIERPAGDKAYTSFMGHSLTSDYVGSLVKRRTSRVDVTVDVLTQDGYKVRVKPIMFTTRQCRDSHKSELRDIATRVIEEHARTTKFDPFIKSLVDGSLASEIYNQGREIYPLRRTEIRRSEVVAEPEEIESIPDGFEEVAESAGVTP